MTSSARADRRPARVYRRLHGSAAALGVILSITPLYKPFILGDIGFSYSNLWLVAADARYTYGWSAGVAVIQLLLLLAWTGCCIVAASRGTATILLPSAIAVLSCIGSGMLLTESEIDQPEAQLSGFGATLVALGFFIAVVSVVQVIHVVAGRHAVRQRPAPRR